MEWPIDSHFIGVLSDFFACNDRCERRCCTITLSSHRKWAALRATDSSSSRVEALFKRWAANSTHPSSHLRRTLYLFTHSTLHTFILWYLDNTSVHATSSSIYFLSLFGDAGFECYWWVDFGSSLNRRLSVWFGFLYVDRSSLSEKPVKFMGLSRINEELKSCMQSAFARIASQVSVVLIIVTCLWFIFWLYLRKPIGPSFLGFYRCNWSEIPNLRCLECNNSNPRES